MKTKKQPWSIGKSIFGEPMVVKRRGKEYVSLAIVSGYTDDEYNNVALMAAAPEMLAALEIAVTFFNNNGGDADYTWLPKLKAAIAKARGEK